MGSSAWATGSPRARRAFPSRSSARAGGLEERGNHDHHRHRVLLEEAQGQARQVPGHCPEGFPEQRGRRLSEGQVTDSEDQDRPRSERLDKKNRPPFGGRFFCVRDWQAHTARARARRDVARRSARGAWEIPDPSVSAWRRPAAPAPTCAASFLREVEAMPGPTRAQSARAKTGWAASPAAQPYSLEGLRAAHLAATTRIFIFHRSRAAFGSRWHELAVRARD